MIPKFMTSFLFVLFYIYPIHSDLLFKPVLLNAHLGCTFTPNYCFSIKYYDSHYTGQQMLAHVEKTCNKRDLQTEVKPMDVTPFAREFYFSAFIIHNCTFAVNDVRIFEYKFPSAPMDKPNLVLDCFLDLDNIGSTHDHKEW